MPVTFTRTHAPYALAASVPFAAVGIGLAPSVKQGGWTIALQIVFGTAVKLELSGEVSNWIAAVSPPVVLKVIRQATHGVALLRFDTPVCTPVPVNVKVLEQSNGVPWA